MCLPPRCCDHVNSLSSSPTSPQNSNLGLKQHRRCFSFLRLAKFTLCSLSCPRLLASLLTKFTVPAHQPTPAFIPSPFTELIARVSPPTHVVPSPLHKLHSVPVHQPYLSFPPHQIHSACLHRNPCLSFPLLTKLTACVDSPTPRIYFICLPPRSSPRQIHCARPAHTSVPYLSSQNCAVFTNPYILFLSLTRFTLPD